MLSVILAVLLTGMFTSCVKEDTYESPTVGDTDLVLNEIMSKDPVTDNDWIELYNKSEIEADISGYLINDDDDPSGGFVVPDGTTIASKGYYIVYEPELSVAISSGGEDVSFGKPDGTLLDLITCPASLADGSTFSRLPDGGDTWLNGTEASPGATNIGDPDTPSVADPQLDLTFSTAPTAGDSILIEVDYSANLEITEARIYFAYGDSPAYLKGNKIKGEDDPSFTQTGVVVNMGGIDALDPVDGSTILGKIGDANAKISFYIRIALENGNEYYYGTDGIPILDDGSDDVSSNNFKDDPTLWSAFTPKNAVVVTKFDFPTNPGSTDDIILDIEYSSLETIEEARIYYAIGDSPVYIKDNKIKGEDDASFTQTGVSINMKNIDIVDENDIVVSSTSDAGAKISFYLRIATATSEYYFALGNLAAIDDTPGGSILDESDAFQNDPTLWNIYNVQNK